MKFGEILEMADSEAFIHPESKKVPAVVHSAVYKKSSNGNDMLVLAFRVTGGPNAGKGRPIRAYMLFNDSGRQQISNLGFPAKEFTSLAHLEAEDAFGKIAAVVAGKPCAIDIVGDTFNGRPQNKIAWIHPASAAKTGPTAEKPAPAKTKVKEVQPEYAAEEEAQAEPEAEEADAELAELEAKLAAKRAAAKPKRSTPPSDLPF